MASVVSGVLLLIGVDYIQLIIPRYVQRSIDVLGRSAFSGELILRYTVLILAMAVGMIVIRFFWRLLIMGSSRKIEREIRQDMFSHLQTLGFTYFNRTQTGSTMALMINDVNAVRMATGPSFIALTDAAFMGSLSLFFMFSINVRLTLYSIAPLPVILLMIAKFGPMIQSRFRAVQESFADVSSRTQEVFSGIRVVKGFVQEKKEIKEFETSCGDYVEKNLALIKIWGLFFPSITLLANLSLAILYLVGGKSVILNQITFGEFVSFGMYINLLVWPVIAIGWVFNLLQKGFASSRRILELMNTAPDVFDSGAAAAPADLADGETVAGDIVIRGLSFSYGPMGRPLLQDVDLTVPYGSSLGIMGKPGSGKSTLVSLLFRLFPFQEDRIFIAGREIHDIPLPVLRRSIGYVPQDSFLFSDTIRNNIAFGHQGEGDEEKEVEKTARLAELYDEIMSFHDGFETLLGERGITLSGGQRQRLSIARALFIKPRHIVFDDAFSAVDAAKETRILRNIHRELEGRTRIIISHRVSTVKDCDNIIVLDGGRIVEQGSHGSLVGKKGYYSRLFALQKLEERSA
jgi:ATP-binding cassette subfamily B multidrug efflux pump